MKIDRLVFFNHYNNGDCFINREYVRDIISKLDAREVYYAHKNHTSITQDLSVTHISLADLPGQVHQGLRIAYDPGSSTMYVNTWVGATVPRYFNWGQHANFVILSRIWQDYYQELNLTVNGDYAEYLPNISFDSYDLEFVDRWIDLSRSVPVILICNGHQQSGQSRLGDMGIVLKNLAHEFPDRIFLSCHRLDLTESNVFYTDDIFGSSTGNLPHISYISQHADLIVGKNSGPFTFAHTQTNLNNADKTFLCFSDDRTSCLTGQGQYWATTLFSDAVEDTQVTETIVKTMATKNKSTEKQSIRTV